MPALSLSHLGTSAGSGLGEAVRPVTGVQRASFEDAMARKGAGTEPAVPQTGPQPATDPAAAAPVRKTGAADLENSAAARDRVRRSLELDATRGASDGDTILGGLQKLRGTFEARQNRIGDLMKSNAVDTNTLLTMQMEVAQYSLLVDVSSKLTGKTTQSLDTLMKGQ